MYCGYGERLRTDYPASAAIFDGIAAQEDTHRKRLIELRRTRFGEVIPLIRRKQVSGYYTRQFVLNYVQPGLAGLMGRSVFTLAPDFTKSSAKRGFASGIMTTVGGLGQTLPYV